MIFRIKISKKFIIRLALFAGILASAMILDIYFDNNSIEIRTEENKPEKSSDEYTAIYSLGQTSNLATKISEQKSSKRKLLGQHDKFLQQYHQSENLIKFKTKLKEPKIPLFLTFHHILFRHQYIPVTKDEPHLS